MKKSHQDTPTKTVQPPDGSKIPTVKPSPVNGNAFPVSSLWKKGVSANPGGMPRGKKVSTRMAEMMTWTRAELEALRNDDEAEVRDHLAARALLRAMKQDDANADMNTVLDRTEGKVVQELNVRAGVAPTLTDEQLAGIAAGTLDPASLVDLGPRVEP